MKTFFKSLLLTIVLVGCKKATQNAQMPPVKDYQTAMLRVVAVDNNAASFTESKVVFIKIEK